MNTLIIILFVVTGLIVLLLIIALFSRKDYNINRNIIINAPLQTVFDYVKLLKNQDNFNKWVMVEPDMQREFKGTDGTVGFIYGWNGKKAGEGEQEIKTITEGKNIETEIRFVRPFAGIAYANMIIEPISENQTKVTWSNSSTIKYPMNIMLPMIEKMLAKDMDNSLDNLKNILEK
ncbi:SRPBCC family protein [Flavobacterium terrisoli]|uniref:SRPBCC family protein n=1 Tax=Flavobacterium terrisoli TaxID=3242195 RepID=UPI002543155B|nr:SRPBCC family protein [Flavobacterium buctense]